MHALVCHQLNLNGSLVDVASLYKIYVTETIIRLLTRLFWLHGTQWNEHIITVVRSVFYSRHISITVLGKIKQSLPKKFGSDYSITWLLVQACRQGGWKPSPGTSSLPEISAKCGENQATQWALWSRWSYLQNGHQSSHRSSQICLSQNISILNVIVKSGR